MTSQFARPFYRCLIFCCFLACSFRALGQANGIYADFTTSMGSFTCKLEYAIAPKAVANFIGLATGQRPWLDLPTGRARTNAFYNGLVFHRVVSNFVIQAGSPSGVGTDGPGYLIPDEISPSLRFTNTGILAMANSGTNSNGSQFFVTLTNRPDLNDGYTAFGELAGGTNVVLAIGQVATDANSKPLTNVVIQSVGIRRVGTAAQAFDINAQNLPGVTNLFLKITNLATAVSLTSSNRLFADNRLYTSTNLFNWIPNLLGIEIGPSVTNTIYQPKDVPTRFYSLAQVQYPSSTFSPKTLLNRHLVLSLSISATNSISFDNAGSGTYTFPPFSNGTILYYTWTQDAYRGFLFLELSGYPYVLSLRCNFSNGGGGIFDGTIYPNYPFTFGAGGTSGSFILN